MTTTRASTPNVEDVMTRDPVCVFPSDTIAEVARLFDGNEISGAPVVNGQHLLLGGGRGHGARPASGVPTQVTTHRRAIVHYFRMDTSDNETRWINLEAVSRVTVATETDTQRPLMVITFVDGCPETRLQIRGTTQNDRHQIERFTGELDALCDKSRLVEAAR